MIEGRRRKNRVGRVTENTGSFCLALLYIRMHLRSVWKSARDATDVLFANLRLNSEIVEWNGFLIK